MSITPLDVDQKQFRVVLRGYDANEVNTFLSQVSRELEEVIRENKQLEEELRRRDENLREYRENESRLREALVSAGRMTEEIKESARKEAELIRAEAELHADKIVASSRERVVQLTEQYHVLRRQKARLLADLQATEAPGGGSMLEKTTLVAFSEFQRTPRLNERNGRDHHLGNCALVAGGGLRGGQVIGSSSDSALGPELIDLASGRSDEGGESLFPEHVLTSALVSAGVDASSLRSAPIPALLRG